MQKWLPLTIALVLNAAANVLMKVGANTAKTLSDSATVLDRTLNFLNVATLVGILLFAANVLIYRKSLDVLNVSVAYPVMVSGGLILVTLAAALLPVLREKISWLQIAGMVVIAIGAIVLILPISSSSGRWTHPIDALFTSTSAVCVTGLIVEDTGSYFSTFGQTVILCLIQAGGLGIMTLSAFAGLVIGRQLSMRSQVVLGQNIGASGGRAIVPLVKYIVVLTVVAEAIGCALLFWRWKAAGVNSTASLRSTLRSTSNGG